ncbi:MAG: SurA N-terminal domain-containing protein [bacterium]|nr:SurA N-terminal domain-containing protein [bacterium]
MMMRRLRTKTVYFLWLLIVVFVAFIFLDWGSQSTAIKKVGKREQGVVAEVNKEQITFKAYDDLTNYYVKDGLSRNEAEKAAFNKLVEDLLINKAIQQKKINITDENIVEFIKTNPPPQLYGDTSLQTQGQFDYNKYLSVISNPSNIEWLKSYEEVLRTQLPRQVLYQMIVGTIRPTTIDFMEEFLQRRTKLKVEYVKAEPEVSPLEIQNYYDKNKDNFTKESKPIVKYVIFPIKTTIEDEMDSKAEAEEILNLALQGGISLDTIAETHNCVLLPEKPENSGIVKKDDGWHISVKKDSIVGILLLPMHPSTETIGKVEESAESFIEEAKSDFDGTAKAYKMEVKTSRIDEAPVNEIDLSYLDFKKKNTVIGPVEGKNAFYVFQTAGTSEKYTPKFNEIADKVKYKYLSDNSPILFKQGFKEFVKSKGLTVISPETFDFYGSPEGPDFFMQAVNIPKDTTMYVVVNGSSYIVHSLDRIQPEADSIKKEMPQFYSIWSEEEGKKIFTEWVNGQKESAKIQDYRYKTY